MDVISSPRPAERRNAASRRQLLLRVQSEFFEMPCLRLTGHQAQRLFALRSDVCDRVLSTLVADGTLTRGADARYGLRADVAWRHRMSRFSEAAQGPAADARVRSVGAA